MIGQFSRLYFSVWPTKFNREYYWFRKYALYFKHAFIGSNMSLFSRLLLFLVNDDAP